MSPSQPSSAANETADTPDGKAGAELTPVPPVTEVPAGLNVDQADAIVGAYRDARIDPATQAERREVVSAASSRRRRSWRGSRSRTSHRSSSMRC